MKWTSAWVYSSRFPPLCSFFFNLCTPDSRMRRCCIWTWCGVKRPIRDWLPGSFRRDPSALFYAHAQKGSSVLVLSKTICAKVFLTLDSSLEFLFSFSFDIVARSRWVQWCRLRAETFTRCGYPETALCGRAD
jgi:hypothetical protein